MGRFVFSPICFLQQTRLSTEISANVKSSKKNWSRSLYQRSCQWFLINSLRFVHALYYMILKPQRLPFPATLMPFSMPGYMRLEFQYSFLVRRQVYECAQ